MSATSQSKRRKGCPVCGRPPTEAHKPFCSARCADIDLGRWFRESYRIPSDEPAPEGGGDPFRDDDPTQH